MSRLCYAASTSEYASSSEHHCAIRQRSELTQDVVFNSFESGALMLVTPRPSARITNDLILKFTYSHTRLPKNGQRNIHQSEAANTMRKAHRSGTFSLGHPAANHSRHNDGQKNHQLHADFHVVDT